MRVGEVWLHKEDGERVRIIELKSDTEIGDEVWFEYMAEDPTCNYLTRLEFIKYYRKEY